MIGIVVGVLLASVVVVLAGNLDSPAAPGATSSYSLEDIYKRLDDGTAGSQSTFTEPGAGPGSTMHTLNDIMGKAPAKDDTNGATTADVANGKTFWGLTSGAWGLQTGQLYGGCTCSGTLHANRWCDNGNGTVTDLTTCLVWLKKADWGGLKPWRNPSTNCSSPSYVCYDDAHTRAGILKAGTAGADLSDGSVEGDWRLPTKTELAGLVNGTPQLRCTSGSCNLYAFTGVQSNYYWSSTTLAYGTSAAWLVYLYYGYVASGGKAHPYSVWPVRGGQ
jgi:hypothetical protein